MSSAPIVLTCGDPAGVGPEIAAKAWGALRNKPACAFFLLGDATDTLARTTAAGLAVPLVPITEPDQAMEIFEQALPVLHMPQSKPSRAGWIDTRNSSFVIDMVTLAANLCLSKRCAAMVTNPIHKDALYAVGFRHQGHTDFLASLAQAEGHNAQEVMMLVGGGLRAIPVTVHVPLKQVPTLLTAEAIMAQAKVVAKSLRTYFGIENPRLAATGLNPHAGENGAMGNEEKTIIVPALERLRMDGIMIDGPLPADTAFHVEARRNYDAILCMYHDQALIPVKTLDFHGGVNVTLGLPYIRTSPDHGTALNLAGTGTSRADSLIAAIELAAQMAASG